MDGGVIEGRRNGKRDSHEQHSGRACARNRRVAVVLLAEAEPAAPVALRHAHVVHDEEVNLERRGARPPDVEGR